MKLKVVAFDVDGTLYPNWIMYLRSIPFGIANFKKLFVFARVRKRIRAIKPIHDFYRLQAELFAGLMNLTLPEAKEQIQRVFYSQWGRSSSGYQTIPVSSGSAPKTQISWFEVGGPV